MFGAKWRVFGGMQLPRAATMESPGHHGKVHWQSPVRPKEKNCAPPHGSGTAYSRQWFCFPWPVPALRMELEKSARQVFRCESSEASPPLATKCSAHGRIRKP